MNKIKTCLLAGAGVLGLALQAQAALPGFYVEGRFLYAPGGEKVVFRGVNEMFVWGDKNGEKYMKEIAKTGSNAVRIVWTLKDGTAAELDLLVQKCVREKMIPIVEFHDATGNWADLQKVVNGWAQPDYVKMIQKHERYLIVNIGNEVGQEVSNADFIAGYDSSVTKLRRAGIRTPLMIDASNYGQGYPMISANAPELIQRDSLKNLLFSVHMWWPIKWNGGTKASAEKRIVDAFADAKAKNIPFLVGEFGEAFTDAGTVAAADSIPFRAILSEAQKNEVGWLAWSWGGVNNSPQSDLNMTNGGTFAGLKGWGLEVATTDVNSIKNTSVMCQYLLDGVAAGTFPNTSNVPLRPSLRGKSFLRVRRPASAGVFNLPGPSSAAKTKADGRTLPLSSPMAKGHLLEVP